MTPVVLAPPRDLTLPDEGSVTARGVLSLALRRVMAELCALPRTAPYEPHEAPPVAAMPPAGSVDNRETDGTDSGNIMRWGRSQGAVALPAHSSPTERTTPC